MTARDRASTLPHGAASPTGGDPADRGLIDRRNAALGASYRLFYDPPIHVARGEGVWLIDKDGRRYLDAYNNVPSVGHAHPRVVRALSEQAAILNTHTRYLHDAVVTYAENLLSRLPDEIDRVVFTCTGSEANDLALRMARAATGGTGIVVTELAYHGGTAAVAEFSPSLGTPLGPHVRTVPAPNTYHAPGEDIGARFARDVASAFDDLARQGHRPAFLILDSIFSSDGVLPDPEGFLAPAVQAARDAGALVIADEVQPGFGRTGRHFWGFERHGVVPDLVTMGKPMAAGHPVAAVAGRADILDGFGRASRYFNTFGGNPVSAVVGQAVLDVIHDEDLQGNAARVGDGMLVGLRHLAGDHPSIGDVRGAGLFIGVELVSDPDTRAPATDLAKRVVDGMRDRSVLISRAGPAGNVLKIRPPMPISEDEADLIVQALSDVLSSEPGRTDA